MVDRYAKFAAEHVPAESRIGSPGKDSVIERRHQMKTAHMPVSRSGYWWPVSESNQGHADFQDK
jgi:hypothetical protein